MEDDSEFTFAQRQRQQIASGTEYAKGIKLGFSRQQEQTSLVAFTINELSVHTETPENQLNEVLQTMIDSGAFEEFRP